MNRRENQLGIDQISLNKIVVARRTLPAGQRQLQRFQNMRFFSGRSGLRRTSYKNAQTFMVFIMLPAIWPAVLSMLLLEKLWDKYRKGTRPETMIGLLSWILCGIFWWLAIPLLK